MLLPLPRNAPDPHLRQQGHRPAAHRQTRTLTSALGREAVGVGVASAMAGKMCWCPPTRDHGAQFVRGVKIGVLPLLLGRRRGSNYAGPRSRSLRADRHPGLSCHQCRPMRSSCARRRRFAVCFLGDGAHRARFLRGLNFAAVECRR